MSVIRVRTIRLFTLEGDPVAIASTTWRVHEHPAVDRARDSVRFSIGDRLPADGRLRQIEQFPKRVAASPTGAIHSEIVAR